MRTIVKSIAAAVIALLGIGLLSAPANAEVRGLNVGTDGFGPNPNQVIIKANAKSATAKTRVSWWSTEIPVSDCDPLVEPACELTYRTQLEVWDPSGKRIQKKVKDGGRERATFSYNVRHPGRYKTEATVTQYLNGVKYDQNTKTTHFRVSKQKKSRLPIKRSRVNRGAFKWKAIGDLNVLNAGPKFERGQKVWLWVRVDGSWYEIDSGRTNRKGKVGWLFKPNRYTWSMCYYGSSDKRVKGTCGRNFTTPRVSGRITVGSESLSDAKTYFG